MLITFKSVISHTKNPNDSKTIEFTSRLNLAREDELKIYEFQDPQTNNMSRIEVKNDEVTIFAGANTLFLKLNEEKNSEYDIEGRSFYFQTLMKELKIQNDNIKFCYSLMFNNDLIGDFEITITVTNEA